MAYHPLSNQINLTDELIPDEGGAGGSPRGQPGEHAGDAARGRRQRRHPRLSLGHEGGGRGRLPAGQVDAAVHGGLDAARPAALAGGAAVSSAPCAVLLLFRPRLPAFALPLLLLLLRRRRPIENSVVKLSVFWFAFEMDFA